MAFLKIQVSCLAMVVLTLVFAHSVRAQGVSNNPSAQQIIDALKPMKTRSMRNLNIKKMAADDGTPTVTPAEQQSPDQVGRKPSIDLAIQFELGSSKVSSDSVKILGVLAEALADPRLAEMRFRVEGHTDSRGSVSLNNRLSQARADEVKRVLVENRIAADRLFSEGRGSSEPINAGDTEAAVNRRVRIVSLE